MKMFADYDTYKYLNDDFAHAVLVKKHSLDISRAGSKNLIACGKCVGVAKQ